MQALHAALHRHRGKRLRAVLHLRHFVRRGSEFGEFRLQKLHRVGRVLLRAAQAIAQMLRKGEINPRARFDSGDQRRMKLVRSFGPLPHKNIVDRVGSLTASHLGNDILAKITDVFNIHEAKHNRQRAHLPLQKNVLCLISRKIGHQRGVIQRVVASGNEFNRHRIDTRISLVRAGLQHRKTQIFLAPQLRKQDTHLRLDDIEIIEQPFRRSRHIHFLDQIVVEIRTRNLNQFVVAL